MTQKDITQTVELACPSCKGLTFELRVLVDEGVACACCSGCGCNYLVLDSEDYWFDLIQTGYPRLRRCVCKSTTWNLRCEYAFRSDEDIKAVQLWSQCSSCNKTKRQTSVDIDYSPTDDLLNRPLRFCKTPDLRYNLREISLYVTPQDMASIVAYLGTQQHCAFTGWLLLDGKWVQHSLDAGTAQKTITSDRYSRIYATLAPLEIADSKVATAKLESAYWKRSEIIRIDSPTTVRMADEAALLFYIQFANECVNDDQVAKKSPAFVNTTTALMTWLGANFVSWRGKHCFDNPAEHRRIFGNRFAKAGQ